MFNSLGFTKDIYDKIFRTIASEFPREIFTYDTARYFASKNGKRLLNKDTYPNLGSIKVYDNIDQYNADEMFASEYAEFSEVITKFLLWISKTNKAETEEDKTFVKDTIWNIKSEIINITYPNYILELTIPYTKLTNNDKIKTLNQTLPLYVSELTQRHINRIYKVGKDKTVAGMLYPKNI
jgi:hypothetical protein